NRHGHRQSHRRFCPAGAYSFRSDGGPVPSDGGDVRGLGDRRHRPHHAHGSSSGVHPMTDPVVEASDVVKFLGRGAGRVEGLRGIGLSLSAGELFILMGPSGSRKTTLLSVLPSIFPPQFPSV